MGRKLAPLFFAAFLAYGYNNIFMTLTPSFVVAAGGTLAEAGLQNSVYLAAAVLLRFAFGPAAGLAVGVVGAVIHGILMADFSGAVMNILVVAGFILPAALVYRRSRTFKSGVVGLVLSAITATVMAILGNLVITPMWLGVPLDAVVAMILPILTPFNLIKAGINAVLTLIVYKSISNLITPKKKQVKGR